MSIISAKSKGLYEKWFCRVSSKNQLDGNSLEAQKRTILKEYPDSIIFSEQYNSKTTDRPIFMQTINKLCSGDLFIVSKLDR